MKTPWSPSDASDVHNAARLTIVRRLRHRNRSAREPFRKEKHMSSTMFASSAGATSVWLLESVPTAWDDRDVCFFRCIFDLFPPAFTLGASVLLASYDESYVPAND